MNIKKHIFASIALLAVAGLISGATAFAADTNQPNAAWGHMRSGMKPGVFGTVSAVNGNTITVSVKQGGRGMMNSNSSSATTAFTVDASNSTVIKNNATSSISAVLVGDAVSIQGVINGTNITATIIRDGVMRGGAGGRGMSSSTLIQGNGQPVIAGTISAINGNTLTVTNKSSVAYTVDVTNAKFLQGQNTIALSNLSVGNAVIVQGAINGNSVTASTVIDQAMPAGAASNQPNSEQQSHGGFFGMIGSFFKSLFGF